MSIIFSLRACVDVWQAICCKMAQPSVILATASYDHTIRFWEAKSGRCYRTIQYPDSVSIGSGFLEFLSSGLRIVVIWSVFNFINSKQTTVLSKSCSLITMISSFILIIAVSFL